MMTTSLKILLTLSTAVFRTNKLKSKFSHLKSYLRTVIYLLRNQIIEKFNIFKFENLNNNFDKIEKILKQEEIF